MSLRCCNTKHVTLLHPHFQTIRFIRHSEHHHYLWNSFFKYILTHLIQHTGFVAPKVFSSSNLLISLTLCDFRVLVKYLLLKLKELISSMISCFEVSPFPIIMNSLVLNLFLKFLLLQALLRFFAEPWSWLTYLLNNQFAHHFIHVKKTQGVIKLPSLRQLLTLKQRTFPATTIHGLFYIKASSKAISFPLFIDLQNPSENSLSTLSKVFFRSRSAV